MIGRKISEEILKTTIKDIELFTNIECKGFTNYLIEKTFIGKKMSQTDFLKEFYEWLGSEQEILEEKNNTKKSIKITNLNSKNLIENFSENNGQNFLKLYSEKNARNLDNFIKANIVKVEEIIIKFQNKMEMKYLNVSFIYKTLKLLFNQQFNYVLIKGYFEYFCDILNENSFSEYFENINTSSKI